MPSRIALRAHLVFPVSSPPIVDGCVTIEGSRIVAVGRADAAAEMHDLGDVAIVPGLVNAHTHLEFADLAAPLGTPGMALPDWIREVMERRRAAPPAANGVQLGLQECLRSGTTALGDIATQDWRGQQAHSAMPLPEVVMFREAIGPSLQRADASLATIEQFLDADVPRPQVRPALSPHAPYTVHPRLLEAIVALARRENLPVAMHLAESREELELLTSGGGPFRALLAELGAWDPASDARLRSVGEYLEALSLAPRALVVHGNYLSATEQEFLAARRAAMCVVYCPRTHAYFAHEPYPLAEMLRRGVSVALGTDSRASNPDLDLWAEMRFVAQRCPQVAPARVLDLGTRGGACALGLAGEIGTLEAGRLANLAVVQLCAEPGEAHERLLLGPSRVVRTYLRGEPIHADPYPPKAGNS